VLAMLKLQPGRPRTKPSPATDNPSVTVIRVSTDGEAEAPHLRGFNEIFAP
jgi:hypothetical protein